MAKYDVTFSCGHTETVELFGKDVDRKRKIAWFERECKCSVCQERESADLRAQRSETLAANGYTFDFDGTEKQAAYAEDIIGCALISIFNAFDDSKCQNACAKLFLLVITAVRKVDLKSAKSVIDAKDTIESDSRNTIKAMKTLIAKNGITAALNEFAEQIKKTEAMIQPKPELPERPEIVKNKKWNGKVYGKQGGYNIYLNGEKTMISDEQAAELKEYSEKAAEAK